jgi:hypothetical protein
MAPRRAACQQPDRSRSSIASAAPMLDYRLGFGAVALIGVAGAVAALARRDDHMQLAVPGILPAVASSARVRRVRR